MLSLLLGNSKGPRTWVTLPMDDNELQQIMDKLAPTNKEDLLVYDYKWKYDIDLFPKYAHELGYDNIPKVNEWMLQLDDLDKSDLKKFKCIIEEYYVDQNEYNIEELVYHLEKLDEVTLYENMSFEDVARELVENGVYGEIPPQLANYINYTAIANQLYISGDCVQDSNTGDIFCGLLLLK